MSDFGCQVVPIDPKPLNPKPLALFSWSAGHPSGHKHFGPRYAGTGGTRRAGPGQALP